MGPSDSDLQRRCNAFTVEVALASCELPESHPWGHTVLTPSLPLVWDANHLLITDAALGASGIERLAEEVLGGAGLGHRSVDVLDTAGGHRLQPEFEALGWEAEPSIAMVLEGAPLTRPDAPAIEISELPQAAIGPLRRALISGERHPFAGSEAAELIEQLLEWAERQSPVAGDSWFTAHAGDGAAASTCRLYGRGGVGRIEDVGTIEAHRERGLGRAVTVAAAEHSLARGDDLTFTTALANDWPQLMYERIGFRTVGTVWTFRRNH